MNFNETLADMLAAAAGAAKDGWKRVRDFAEQEFRALATAAHQLESELIADLAAAAKLKTKKERDKAVKIAKLRARQGFAGLKRAAEGALIVAAADAKLAAQNAINAAVGVLATAINTSVGVAVL